MAVDLSLANVGFTYNPGKPNQQVVLSGVDLLVEHGEVLGITGLSGGGKTTLLKLAAALEPPTSGSVLLMGERVETLSPRARTRLRRERIGLVTQRGDLDDNLSVLNNVVKTTPFCTGRSVSKQKANQLFRSVGLDPAIGKRLPSTLSGGERQRVALAVALSGDPDILFLDEPTSALDPQNERLVLEVLRAAKEGRPGMTIVIVSHHVAVVDAICTKVVHMENGTLTPV